MKFKHLNQDVIVNVVKQSIVKDSLLSGLPRPARGLAMTRGQIESGRSMVEMLGVLAIMGILTIGGIAGFNYAMDKSKANDILDGVNKRAIALSSYTLLGMNISNTTLDAEFSNRIGDATVALSPDGAGFKLTVSGLTNSVCDKVLDNGLKMASQISLGETTVWEQGVKSDHTCAEKDNEIVFAFNASLDGTQKAGSGSGGGAACGYCQHKENNTCVADVACDNGCPGDKPMKNSAGSCLPCSYERGTLIDLTECQKCSNRIMSYNGYCFPCDSDSGIMTNDEAECAKCSNRFMGANGICQHCNISGSVATDAQECGRCPNRVVLSNGRCALPCPAGQFMENYGYMHCYSCSIADTIPADAAECAKCPNRKMQEDGTCVLK